MRAVRILPDVALPPVHHLIPHLPVLHRQITRDFDFGGDDYRSVHFQLELLPYCLGAASLTLETLISEIQILASDNLPYSSPKHETIISPKPEDTERLRYQVDHFLDVTRRAQNAWITYLRLGLRLQRYGEQLPKSLHSVMTGLDKGRDTGFPRRSEVN